VGESAGPPGTPVRERGIVGVVANAVYESNLRSEIAATMYVRLTQTDP
jgi:hypothetical protein